jgi:CHAD domain-containing protein
LVSNPPTAPTDRASALLRERVRAVFKRLPKGLAGNEEAVHQMRVAGRRLRVAIPLLARKPEGKRARRAVRVLRELTRAAGSSRDLDVCLDLLNAHLRETGAPSRETIALRRRLRTARSRSRAQMAEALLDLEIARLRRDLRKILARKADGLFGILGRIRATRSEEGRGLLAGFRGLGDRYDPEALHALRRQARRLRYAAEVHDLLMRDEPSEAPALFKSLQEQIGALHDVHVLAGWLAAQARAATERGQTAQTEAAAALQAAFEGKARDLHRALLEAEPSEIASRALLALGRNRSAA